MNWYKKNQSKSKIDSPYLPDREELEFLTGRDPDEPESKLPTTYQPDRSYKMPVFPQIREMLTPYEMYMIDLNSEIAVVEETIEGLIKDLKKYDLLTRSKRKNPNLFKEKEKIKFLLRDEIKRLRRLKALLKREKSKKTVYPESIKTLKKYFQKNWYKKAQNKPFFSDDSYGNFSVTIKGKTYNYYNMSPHQIIYYKKLFTVAPNRAFNELKNSKHSRPDLHPKEPEQMILPFPR